MLALIVGGCTAVVSFGYILIHDPDKETRYCLGVIFFVGICTASIGWSLLIK